MGNGISKVLAAIFGVIVLGAVVALDFQRFAARAEGDGGPRAYFAQLTAGIAPLLDRTPPVTIADHLPSAPQGWERRPLTQADAEAITGLPYDKDNAAPDLTQDIVKRLLLPRYDDRRIVEAYVSTDAVVALRVEVTPPGKQFSPSAKLKRRAEAKLRDSLISAAVFAENGALRFHAMQQVTIDPATGATTPVEYRRFWAGLEGRLEVEVVTNADDEALLPILQGLNAAALMAMTEAPEAEVIVADAAPEAAAPAATTISAGEGTVESTGGGCVRRAGKLTCN
ncbi:MAG: hypothetical protein V4712_17965 [Pseudomonadota bacterium]